MSIVWCRKPEKSFWHIYAYDYIRMVITVLYLKILQHQLLILWSYMDQLFLQTKEYFLYSLVTVLYLKISWHQLEIWWSQIELTGDALTESVNRHLQPWNWQLLPWNFQIQYSYLHSNVTMSIEMLFLLHKRVDIPCP
jgi:hypothetical protein